MKPLTKTKPAQRPRAIDDVIRPAAQKQTRQRLVSYQVLVILCTLLAAISVGLLIFIFLHARNENKPKIHGDDVASVKTAVNEHYELPVDEEPALATVTDKAKLSSAFKGRAENGDRILIYQKNQIAVLYRPSTDKVVGVVPVNIDAPQAAKKN